MKQIKLKFIGQTPIILSSENHKKAGSDFKQWESCLYYDKNIGVYVPSENIMASIVSGAKINKIESKIKSSMIPDKKIKLDYGKDKTIEQLWKEGFNDAKSVFTEREIFTEYRPKFADWMIIFDFCYNESIINQNQVLQSAISAGLYVGLGESRKEHGGMFGLFKVEVITA